MSFYKSSNDDKNKMTYITQEELLQAYFAKVSADKSKSFSVFESPKCR